MKTTKRILACLMILAMLAAMLCGSASAADSATITINGTAGATYSAYKILDVEGTSNSAVLYTWDSGITSNLKSAVNAFVTETIAGLQYVTVTNVTSFANAVIALADADKPTPTTVTLSGGTGTMTLENGYYVMKSSVSSAPYAFSVINGKLAGVDNVYYAAATNTVTEKSQIPNITISVKEDSTSAYGSYATAEIEQVIDYKMVLTVRKDGINYVVDNTLDSQLTLDTSSVKVTFGGSPVTAALDTYQVTATANSLVIKFADSYIATFSSGDEINITYSAIINDTAEANTAYASDVNLYHGENLDDTINGTNGDFIVDATATNVKTFALEVFKHDESNAPLANAQFTLGSLKFSQRATNVYVVDPDGTITTITTDATGTFTIIGLDNDDYTLTETQAPVGYHGADPKTVSIADGDTTEAKVLNKTGSALPETGGIGTTVFYAVGGMLVLGAVVVLLMKKRSVTE